MFFVAWLIKSSESRLLVEDLMGIVFYKTKLRNFPNFLGNCILISKLFRLTVYLVFQTNLIFTSYSPYYFKYPDS